MNNAPVIVCLLMCIGAGIYALYLHNLERPVTEYHLFHGPNSDCPDCEDK